MFEDFINALNNFKMNKTRTFLSLLGVIIGVASVIIITTLGESATANIVKSFGTSGLDQVFISQPFGNRRSSSSVQFNETYRQDIWDNIENLKGIYYTNSFTATIVYGDNSTSSNATSIENNYLEMSNIELASGEYFTVSDNVQGAQKAIISTAISEELFPEEDALGKKVTLIINNARFGFEITGIIDSEYNDFYVPRGFYAKKVSPNPVAAEIIIQCTDQDLCTTVVADIEEYMKNRTGQDRAIRVSSMQNALDEFNEVMGTITLLLSGIAAISLLVGGIGIMNIMIVTVTERKKEIGIRKALGATPNAIRVQFLVESATITLLGGFFGIAFGVGISYLVVSLLDWSFAVKWSSCIIAFVFSAFVGVFFGLSPASRASKLDPVAVLSAE